MDTSADNPAAMDERMMRLAIEQARLAATLGEVPVGAVIHRGGEVIASAHNRRELDQDPVAHAEIIALRAASKIVGSWRLEKCTIVVTLEPCPMCAGALVNSRMQRLVYGASDPKMGCVHTLHQLCTEPRFNHRLQVTSGVLAGECGGLLSDFFRQRRKEN